MAASLCAPRPGLSLTARQHLFSLYVHAASNFTGVFRPSCMRVVPTDCSPSHVPRGLSKFLFSN